MITWIPYTGYGTMEQREKPPRNERFHTQRVLTRVEKHAFLRRSHFVYYGRTQAGGDPRIYRMYS
jgi:hypothetical protein